MSDSFLSLPNSSNNTPVRENKSSEGFIANLYDGPSLNASATRTFSRFLKSDLTPDRSVHHTSNVLTSTPVDRTLTPYSDDSVVESYSPARPIRGRSQTLTPDVSELQQQATPRKIVGRNNQNSPIINVERVNNCRPARRILGRTFAQILEQEEERMADPVNAAANLLGQGNQANNVANNVANNAVNNAANVPANNNAQPVVQALNQDFINERALHLLLQIPVFTGHPGIRFNEWIRHIDDLLEPTYWAEADKIRALSSRLSGSAYDVLVSVREPEDTYIAVKNKIRDRYHGAETHAFFQREYEDRCRKPGESIPDYAYSLKNLLIQAYPHLATPAQRFPLLKRAFLKGLSSELRMALVNFEYETYEQLVQRANNIDAQQAAEREETSTSRSNFVRAVTSTVVQPSVNDSLLTTIKDLAASVAALKTNPGNTSEGENSNRDKGKGKKNFKKESSGKYCGFCGGKSHYADNCFVQFPEKRKQRPNRVNNMACCFCNSEDHLGRDCPNRPKTGSSGRKNGQGNE